MTNPIKDAIPLAGTGPAATLRQKLAEAVALPLKDAAAVAAFNTVNLATDGTPYPAVIYAGSVFEYDSTDGSSAHDPDNGCITDASGRRYKRSSAIRPGHIVLDKDLDAPPADPGEGDAYFVATAATGAWAGHDDEVAIYGRTGWHFREVTEGDILYVADEASYYHMPSSGTLTKGLGDLALADGAIRTRHLERKYGLIIAEAEQNAPPGSLPGAGVAYIVGATPSGDWASHAGKVAESNGTGWEFFAAPEGAHVFDKGAGYLKKRSGGSWVAAITSAGVLQTKLATLVTKSSGFSTAGVWDTIHTFAAVTASSTSNRIAVRFSFDYKGQYSGSGARGNLSVGLFVDSEATARMEYVLKHGDFPTSPSAAAYDTPATGIFYLTPADLSAHDIHLKVKRSGNEYFTEVTGGLAIELMEVAQ